MSFREGIIDCTGGKNMLYLTSTMISSVDLAYYGGSHAKDLVSVDCGTIIIIVLKVKQFETVWFYSTVMTPKDAQGIIPISLSVLLCLCQL